MQCYAYIRICASPFYIYVLITHIGLHNYIHRYIRIWDGATLFSPPSYIYMKCEPHSLSLHVYMYMEGNLSHTLFPFMYRTIYMKCEPFAFCPLNFI